MRIWQSIMGIVQWKTWKEEITGKQENLPFLIQHGFVIHSFTRVKMDPSVERKKTAQITRYKISSQLKVHTTEINRHLFGT